MCWTLRAPCCTSIRDKCRPWKSWAHDGASATQEGALETQAIDPDPARRALAVEGLARLGRIDGKESESWLRDPDTLVVQTALRVIPTSHDPKVSEILTALANHPDWRIAESARVRLHDVLPADPRQRRLRELATEHPYVRGQLIEALAADGSPAALADLEAATEIADAHTRALCPAAACRRRRGRAGYAASFASCCVADPESLGAPACRRRGFAVR